MDTLKIKLDHDDPRLAALTKGVLNILEAENLSLERQRLIHAAYHIMEIALGADYTDNPTHLETTKAWLEPLATIAASNHRPQK